MPLIPALKKQRQAGTLFLSLGVQSHLGLHSNFQSNKDYTEKPRLRRGWGYGKGEKERRREGEGGNPCQVILTGVLTAKTQQGVAT